MILSFKLPTSLFSVYSLTDSEFYVGAKSTSSGLSWVDGGSLIKPATALGWQAMGNAFLLSSKTKRLFGQRVIGINPIHLYYVKLQVKFFVLFYFVFKQRFI